VIVNFITKAVTAPFALLGSLFGGGGGGGAGDGGDLAWLDFDPGRFALSDAAQAKLQTLSKALAGRPGLKLEITGRTDAEADREALRRLTIDRKVRALKIKDLLAKGEAAEPRTVQVKPEEYPALLARAYREEKFAKPKSAPGVATDPPVAEMEKSMLANVQVSDDDLTALGNQRAQAAKDWLVTKGQVAADRVFVVASKPVAAGAEGAEGGKGKATRVDFSLK
jgi:outer membrane protein OmpA-like peptidoglycan-associated protein